MRVSISLTYSVGVSSPKVCSAQRFLARLPRASPRRRRGAAAREACPGGPEPSPVCVLGPQGSSGSAPDLRRQLLRRFLYRPLGVAAGRHLLPPLHPWRGWGWSREAGDTLCSPSSRGSGEGAASSAARSVGVRGGDAEGARWDGEKGQARLAHPALLLPQPRQNHVGGDRERPHGGPGGDSGIQLQ